jgi:hypothetical protein
MYTINILKLLKVSNLQEVMALLIFCTAQLKNQTKKQKNKQTCIRVGAPILQEESNV